MTPGQAEIRTINAMIRMYCRAHHGKNRMLCAECRQLSEYAQQRILQCPLGDGKVACSKCTVHCYQPEMRTRVIEVMRFAGPKMIYRHPVLAIRHVLRTKAGHQEHS
ncbi:MAG: nitrous oxide-stimulated promoter family protein [Kiritimatiellales bacterium]|nr:nitrous oxide-stimulated promoter family protein [Kiritimatiellales bacterium]